MNNPNPLIPEGSTLEQKNKTRARVRLAVFVVLSVLVVGLMGLLMQGCKKPPEPEPEAQRDTNAVIEPTPYPDTNISTTASNAVAPPGAPAITAPAAAQEYTVMKGDSFYTISKKFGVTIKQIQEANPTVQPTKLQVGQKLQIPAAAPAAQAPTATAPDTTSGQDVYTVKSGDTLTQIAADHHITVKAIRAANNLTTDKIKVGQKLKLPPKTSAPGAAAPVEPTPAPPTPPAPAAAAPTLTPPA